MFRHCYGLLAAALVIAAGVGVAVPWPSSDDFLGVLALAVEDEVGPRIDLTETQKKTLLGLIEQRENAAVELAMSLKDAPAEERTKQLDAFRHESEAKALAVLSPQQRSRLEGIRVPTPGDGGRRRSGRRQAIEPDARATGQDRRIGPRADRATGQGRREIGPGDSRRVGTRHGRRLERRAADGVGGRGRGRGEARPDAGRANRCRRRPAALRRPGIAAPPRRPPTAPATPRRPRRTKHARATGRRATAPRRRPTPPAATQTAENPRRQARGRAEPEPVKLPDKLRFSFRFQPWGDVLDWFAKQAGLSLVMDAPPPGTFNYTDDREYTPAEMIDVLNSVLLTKGYTLVRRERMLMLVNLEDGIPPNLVETVTPEDLDSRGEFELVRAVFSLEKLTAEDAEAEVEEAARAARVGRHAAQVASDPRDRDGRAAADDPPRARADRGPRRAQRGGTQGVRPEVRPARAGPGRASPAVRHSRGQDARRRTGRSASRSIRPAAAPGQRPAGQGRPSGRSPQGDRRRRPGRRSTGRSAAAVAGLSDRLGRSAGGPQGDADPDGGTARACVWRSTRRRAT